MYDVLPKFRFLSLGSIPHFFKRSAVTHDLFDMIVELRQSSTSAGLAENIKRELLQSDLRFMLTVMVYPEIRATSARVSPEDA